VVGLAVAVLMLAVAGGAGAWWLAQWRSGSDARLNLALHEADALRAQARALLPGEPALARWVEAEAAGRRLDDLLAQGFPSAELRQRVRDSIAALGEEAGAARRLATEEKRDRQLLDQLAEVRTQKEDQFGKSQSDFAYAKVFQDYGVDVDGLSATAVAERLGKKAPAFVLEVAAALDDWAMERRRLKRPAAEWQRLVAVARALDKDPWRDALRALDYAHVSKERDQLRELVSTAKVADLPTASVLLLGRALTAAGENELAIKLLREAQRLHPGDVWLNYELAEALGKQLPSQWPEAVRFYTAARSLRPEIGHALGHALQAMGRREEAAAVFAELVRLRPRNPRHHNCLGNALMNQGKLAEAETELRTALKLTEAQAVEFRTQDYRPNEAGNRKNLGTILRRQGKLAEAESEYRTSRKLWEVLAAESSDVRDYKNGLAIIQDSLGFFLVQKGDLLEAEAELRAAVKGFKSLVAEASLVAEYRQELAKEHSYLECVLWLRGKPDEAEAEGRAALEVEQDSRHLEISFRGNLYEVARLYALASAIPTLEPQQADECAAWAVELLQKIVSAEGFKTPTSIANLKTIRDLDPLRNREDFRQLLKQLEETKAPAKPPAQP
jgi:Flp pilus assembly protein TadD